MLDIDCKYKRKCPEFFAWQLTLKNFNKKWPDFIKTLVKEKKIYIWSYDNNSKVNGMISLPKQFIRPGDYIVLDTNKEEYLTVYPEKNFNDLFKSCV